MITKITETNKELYFSLFQEINELVFPPPSDIKIDTIEEYFLNLEAIAAYVSGQEDKTYFLRLPTDEKLFEINANTRVINVPEHFRKNGIAVAGDSYAETVWFKIDKYFDIQDLGTNDIQIRIYWELPGTKLKGYSTPQFKDVWSEAGYVLFGWTIPSLLTDNSGNITFSISFFDDNGQISYQLNTLPQTVRVNANPFRKDLDYEEDGTGRETILNRLKNSASSAIFVSPPVFSILKPTTIGEEQVFVGEGDSCDLIATAYAPLAANAEIEYAWFKGGSAITEGVSIVYVRSEGEYNSNKQYYASEGGDVLDGETAALRLASNQPVYEKGTKLTAATVGNYQVKAIAKVTTSGSNAPSRSRPSYSSLWVFEAPNAIQGKDIVVEITENGIIHGGNNDPIMKLIYPTESGQQQYAIWTAEIYKNNESVTTITGNTYPITSEGEYYAKVTKTLNNESLAAVETTKVVAQQAAIPASVATRSGETSILIALGSAAPELVYNYNNPNGLQQTYEYIYYVKGKTNSWKQVGAAFKQEPTNYIPNETGHYAMIIKSTYKKDVALSKDPSQLSDSDILFTVWSL